MSDTAKVPRVYDAASVARVLGLPAGCSDPVPSAAASCGSRPPGSAEP
jgi:hypothetical protein